MKARAYRIVKTQIARVIFCLFELCRKIKTATFLTKLLLARKISLAASQNNFFKLSQRKPDVSR
ncbi:MAG TPA: hypothetical protein DCK93_22380 [Blastocatellia bacterium]|nr:hypothetical protein [Blastocatellia bacterium]HAF25619.1 hypothetical protein [Blastocatellia bacterium]